MPLRLSLTEARALGIQVPRARSRPHVESRPENEHERPDVSKLPTSPRPVLVAELALAGQGGT